MIGRTLKIGSTALSAVALAVAFTAAPAVVGYGPLDAAAHAKGGNGKGGGNGGGKGANKSASAKSKAGGGNGATKRRNGGNLDRAIGRLLGTEKQKSRTTRTARGGKAATATVEEVEVVSTEEPISPLSPDQKGKWNAANANQRALDVHIEKEKYNGTIGALAYYQLAGKAASGEELNEYEQRALDNLLAGYDGDLTDGELEDLLNTGEDGAPIWEVVDGAASCVDNCDTADQDAANQQIADLNNDAAVQELWSDAQQRIIDDSNKPTEGIEDQLLDELATQLGFERYDPEEDVIDPDVDEEVVVVDDEVIIITE